MQAWPLIDAALVGPLRRSPGRNALLALAIALGVALGFAIYLINRSAADEVSLAARSFTVWPIWRSRALPASTRTCIRALPLLPAWQSRARWWRWKPSLRIAAARSRCWESTHSVRASCNRRWRRSPDDVERARLRSIRWRYFSAPARPVSCNGTPGTRSRFRSARRRSELRVAGVLPQAGLEDRAGVMDIAAAQWKFGRLGKLSRINVRLASGAPLSECAQDIAALLPPRRRVTTPGEASNEALRLSRAYRSNLTALALVALFTGGFFVYSTQSLATLRRRREFAVLHALGVTRGQQLVLVLAGSAIIGAFGASPRRDARARAEHHAEELAPNAPMIALPASTTQVVKSVTPSACRTANSKTAAALPMSCVE